MSEQTESRVGGVIGRDGEVAAIAQFLGAEMDVGTLVLAGQSGVGKTTLWEVGVRVAQERGWRVLIARASEAEAKMSFAALSDLLDDVGGDELTALPVPQRHALEVALVRAEPAGAPPERLAIAAGVLAALRALSLRDPVLIAVDDLPWLDSASEQTLAFAARRIAGERLRFLLATRAAPRSSLERAVEPAGVRHVEVGALGFAATRRLLRQRLGLGLPARVLRRVFESSDGNPLVALELGRLLLERGASELGGELPVPELASELFGTRVSVLPEPVRRVLLAVALGAGLTRSELGGVAEPVALEEAVSAGLVAEVDSRVRPSHPLLAAAAVSVSGADERQALHLDLARVAGDRTSSARHLALGTSDPNPGRASTIAEAASEASRRGAAQDAVELAEHAQRLTAADDPDHAERLLALAGYLENTGEYARMTELLLPWLDRLPRGETRARAHLLLVEAGETAEQIGGHLELALAESEQAPQIRAVALARKAVWLAIEQVVRIEEAEALAREALRLVGSSGSEDSGAALLALALAGVMWGRPVGETGGKARPDGAYYVQYADWVDRAAGIGLAFRGRVDEARELFRRMLSLAQERGTAALSNKLCCQLSELELRAGDARAAQRRLVEWDEWTAPTDVQAEHARCQALLAVLLGDLEAAAEQASRALMRSEAEGSVWNRLEAWRALGIAGLLAHEPERAVESLRAVWEHTEREGVRDPGAFPVAPDLVEALAEVGRTDEALAVTSRLRELADEQQHPWGLASARRCHALVQLRAGYDQDAADRLVQAAAAYEQLGLHFDHARSLLLLGRAQRRHKKWGAARDSLEHSAAAFEQLGCTGWVEQARSELGRVGARRRQPDHELTDTEERIARLAADGMSNKEIAGELFITVHTVEKHLTHAYAKLRIRSRAQLATRLPQQQADERRTDDKGGVKA